MTTLTILCVLGIGFVMGIAFTLVIGASMLSSQITQEQEQHR